MFRRYAQDPAVTRYLSWTPHADVEESHAIVERMIRSWDTGEAFVWGAHDLSADDTAADGLIGTVGLESTPHGLELGYVLARDRWGEGLMTEAASPVVEWARARPDRFRVGAYCHVDNPASARVLEKVGLHHEARLCRWVTFPNVSQEPQDVLVYAWTR